MMWCSSVEESDEQGLKNDYSLNPKKESAGKNDGCTDKNGKRRKIGEKWSTKIGCNSGRLVSN